MRPVATGSNLAIEFHLEDGGAPQEMAREVREGLASVPKRLPSKYFYDERGSWLFEEITRLPEYYLTRVELALLKRFGREIARITRVEEIIEPGSGATKKVRLLIDAGLAEGTLRRYVPVEVSEKIVEQSARELAADYPELEVHVVIGDFDRHLGEVPHGERRLVLLLGSTIGNFSSVEARAFLRKIAHLMNEDDWFLLGTDLVKDRAVMEAAYNDSRGVTAEFNRNILNVINYHLDGDFDPGSFEHVAYFNEEESRIESYLRSTSAQTIPLGSLDLEVEFAAGELLWTEISCKYTRESVQRLLAESGLRLEHWFTDENQSFALSLSRLA